MTRSTYEQLLIKSLFNSEAFFQPREISSPAAECGRSYTGPRPCQLSQPRSARRRHPRSGSCCHPEPLHPLRGSCRHPLQQTAESACQGRPAKSPEGGSGSQRESTACVNRPHSPPPLQHGPPCLGERTWAGMSVVGGRTLEGDSGAFAGCAPELGQGCGMKPVGGGSIDSKPLFVWGTLAHEERDCH